MTHDNLLVNTIPFHRKISLFIEYLQKGGELEIEGRTYVWLDNHVTSEVPNDDGTTTYYGIDGLAIKGVSINTSTGEEKPHYMGQSDMPLHQFLELVEQLTEEDLFQITAGITLQSMNKKR